MDTTQQATTDAAPASSPTTPLQGYETFTGAGRSASPLKGTIPQPKEGGFSINYETCTSVESLLSMLDVSTDVGASFGGSDVDNKLSWVQSFETTSTSVVVAVRAAQNLGVQQPTDVTLAETPTSPLEFFRAYGDSYVSEMTLGGEYIALYFFYAESTEEQTTVTDALTANYVSGGDTVTADLNTNLQNVRQNLQMRTSFHQNLFGYTNLATPSDPGELADFANGLVNHMPNSPSVLSFAPAGYEDVVGMPVHMMDAIVATRELFVDKLSAMTAGLTDLQNRIDWIEELYTTYGYTGDTDLSTRAAQVKADSATLTNLIQDQIHQDPTQQYAAPSLPSLDYGLPQLNVDGPQLPSDTSFPYGGPDGQYFSVPGRQQFLEQWRMTKLESWSDDWIDKLQVTGNGAGGAATTYGFGGDGHGYDDGAIEPSDGETISQVDGQVGSDGYVDQLILTTTNNQRLAGGPATGNEVFRWEPAANEIVVGFEGRSDRYLNAIGPLVCAFSPAVWK
jgi:hypothetical protein